MAAPGTHDSSFFLAPPGATFFVSAQTMRGRHPVPGGMRYRKAGAKACAFRQICATGSGFSSRASEARRWRDILANSS